MDSDFHWLVSCLHPRTECARLVAAFGPRGARLPTMRILSSGNSALRGSTLDQVTLRANPKAATSRTHSKTGRSIANPPRSVTKMFQRTVFEHFFCCGHLTNYRISSVLTRSPSVLTDISVTSGFLGPDSAKHCTTFFLLMLSCEDFGGAGRVFIRPFCLGNRRRHYEQLRAKRAVTMRRPALVNR